MRADTNRFKLRHRTRDLHEKLDNVVGAIVDHSGYARYLSGISRFRQPVEAELNGVAFPPEFGDWRPMLISTELKQDLEDLDITTAADDDRVPPRVISVRDVSSLVGMLYVLEGSSLGARLIARQAGELGFRADYGARHLARQTGSNENWAGFVDIIETIEGLDIDRAAQAATATFEAAHRAFRGA